MPERFFYLVVVLIFLFYRESSGQQIHVDKFLKNAATERFRHAIFKLEPEILKFSKNLSGTSLYPKNIGPVNLSTGQKIPLRISFLQNKFDIQKLSFFCQKEWQFEKVTSIPLRFRLGSVEYTNYLEQKPNASRLQ